MAKIRLLESDELKPGAVTWAQFVLDRPIPVVDDDHFVIRSTTDTLGGGKIVDAHAKHLRRRKEAIINRLQVKEQGSFEDVTYSFLETRQPVELGALLNQGSASRDEVTAVVDALIKKGRVLSFGTGDEQVLFTLPGWVVIKKKAEDILSEYHKKFPIRQGMSKEELRNKLKLGSAISLVLQKLVEEKVITEVGTDIRLPSFEIQLTLVQKNTVNAFLIALIKNPYNPPSDLIPEPDLLNYLIQQAKVVKVTEDVVFSTTAYSEMVNKVIAYLKTNTKVTMAEVRDLLGTSRKYAGALLENMDSRKITRKAGDTFDRVLYQGQ